MEILSYFFRRDRPSSVFSLDEILNLKKKYGNHIQLLATSYAFLEPQAHQKKYVNIPHISQEKHNYIQRKFSTYFPTGFVEILNIDELYDCDQVIKNLLAPYIISYHEKLYDDEFIAEVVTILVYQLIMILSDRDKFSPIYHGTIPPFVVTILENLNYHPSILVEHSEYEDCSICYKPTFYTTKCNHRVCELCSRKLLHKCCLCRQEFESKFNIKNRLDNIYHLSHEFLNN